MPQIFKVGSYIVYFWVNEGDPLEPVHVHVSEKRPTKNSTKIWITAGGKCLLANNASQIPQAALTGIMRIIETRAAEIMMRWKELFGQAAFYC